MVLWSPPIVFGDLISSASGPFIFIFALSLPFFPSLCLSPAIAFPYKGPTDMGMLLLATVIPMMHQSTSCIIVTFCSALTTLFWLQGMRWWWFSVWTSGFQNGEGFAVTREGWEGNWRAELDVRWYKVWDLSFHFFWLTDLSLSFIAPPWAWIFNMFKHPPKYKSKPKATTSPSNPWNPYSCYLPQIQSGQSRWTCACTICGSKRKVPDTCSWHDPIPLWHLCTASL